MTNDGNVILTFDGLTKMPTFARNLAAPIIEGDVTDMYPQPRKLLVTLLVYLFFTSNKII